MVESIDKALSTTTQSLSVLSQQLGVIAMNIENVANPDYVRRGTGISATALDGATTGIAATEIFRYVDPYIQNDVRMTKGQLAEQKVIQDYAIQAQVFFGSPTDTTNLHRSVGDFFSAIQALTIEPSTPAVRVAVFDKGQNLANRMSNMASNLQQLRQNIDLKISEEVTNLNTYLNNLYSTTQALAAVNVNSGNSSNVNDLLDGRDTLVNAISELLSVTVTPSNSNSVIVNALSGPLFSVIPAQVNYAGVANVNTLINNDPLNPMTFELVNPQNKNTASSGSFTMISGGTQGNINSYLGNGKLAGLQYMRDVYIPTILTELDEFSSVLRDSFNAVHNLGSGYPPATTLNGSELLTITDERNFTGSVNIALVDQSGNPIIRPDGTGLPPLTLNLGTLNSGTNDGLVSYQTIVNEINQYFINVPTQNRAQIGDLYDIKLAATSSTISPTSTFSFDFELTSIGQELNGNSNTTFQILSVSANNGVTPPATLPSQFLVSAGERVRTGAPITLDLSTGSGGPYTITVEVEVTNTDGSSYTASLEYLVNDHPANPNILNQRYSAQAMIGGTAVTPDKVQFYGPPQLVMPGNVQSYAQAQFVDASGNPLNNLTQQGYLQISSLNSNWGIVINDVAGSPTKELGYSTNGVVQAAPTYRGFSHYFGMNDFFVNDNLILDNPIVGNDNANSAITLGIRSDIVNPTGQAPKTSLISAGLMSASPNTTIKQTIGATAANGTMKFTPSVGTNFAAGDSITLNGVTTYTFEVAPVGPYQIGIGATLAASLTNAVTLFNTKNAANAAGTNLCTYTLNSDNQTISVDYNGLGTGGNGFTIGASIPSSNVAVSVNNTVISTYAQSAELTGGTSKEVEQVINPYTMNIGIHANQVAIQLFQLSSQSFSFDAAGGIPAVSTTFEDYVSDITAIQSGFVVTAENNVTQVQSTYDAIYSRYRSISGVNSEMELIQMNLFVQTYNATLVARGILFDLYAKLLQITS